MQCLQCGATKNVRFQWACHQQMLLAWAGVPGSQSVSYVLVPFQTLLAKPLTENFASVVSKCIPHRGYRSAGFHS
eukprot:2888043-Amphidinium_carterae.1